MGVGEEIAVNPKPIKSRPGIQLSCVEVSTAEAGFSSKSTTESPSYLLLSVEIFSDTLFLSTFLVDDASVLFFFAFPVSVSLSFFSPSITTISTSFFSWSLEEGEDFEPDETDPQPIIAPIVYIYQNK